MLVTLIISLLVSFSTIESKEVLNNAYNNGTCSGLDLEILNNNADAEWYYLRGLCECQTRNYEKAKLSFNLADSLGFDSAPVTFLVNKARVEAQLSNKTLAFAYVNRAIVLGFSNVRVLEGSEFDFIREDEEFKILYESVEPSFDTWTSLFLFVSLQAVFIFLVLANFKGSNKQANSILAFQLLVFAIILFSYVMYWTKYNAYFPYLNLLYFPLMYLSGPLFYLYLRSVVKDTRLRKQDVIHFLPPVIILILILPAISANWSNQLHSGVWLGWSGFISLGVNPILKVVYLGFYLLLSYRLIYETSSENSYLNSWFKYLMVGYTGYYLSIAAYYILVNYSFFNPTWDYLISFTMAFFIFSVSFLGYIYPQVLAGKPLRDIVIPFKYQNSGLTEAAEILLKDELRRLMEDDQIYLQQMSLSQMAELSNSTRHNVSLVINKHFHTNYFDFLNKYRVEYVKKLLKNPDNKSTPIIQLAYDSGFNNKVSFNKAFKKHTGYTPQAYKATEGKIDSISP